ncbi:Fructoselysine-6-P-deglycase FrlB with duplicated sugar isomerase (SIS) domain [Faunimonas pinastri]|uniref:Glutamine--fructose-6-phosphate aminotransferase [isomerizing] n=1 Tax=Faunimonas pinastri TaxID=1855383 RepID=A0A1H9PBG3_9HYPH|nr:hypothetical protein [Faunimonas pinastri]SER45482.1 Fructoselysine-6-P-deglycase FrlB with duplicated sugar isomerase (SIS) domain [Faunimonas pinastri]
MTHTTTEPQGLTALRSEMALQFSDALASYDAAHETARAIAESLRRTRRLHLVGMGASHWVNRIVEPFYRQAGIDATCYVASEILRSPVPGKATVLLTSQSGGSGEILLYLDQKQAELDEVFGLTLGAESGLARRVRSLIGNGGSEKAFAATRSLTISLALHAAILNALGADVSGLIEFFRNPVEPETQAATDALSRLTFAIFSSRGAAQGVVEAASLTFMELARIPVLALEGGQFRHGPLEVLNKDTGVVLLRPASDARAVADVAAICVAAGIRPVVFDISGEAPLPDCLNVTLPRLDGLAALAAGLVAMQKAIVFAAAVMVPDIGSPVRSTKVTNGE